MLESKLCKDLLNFVWGVREEGGRKSPEKKKKQKSNITGTLKENPE